MTPPTPPTPAPERARKLALAIHRDTVWNCGLGKLGELELAIASEIEAACREAVEAETKFLRYVILDLARAADPMTNMSDIPILDALGLARQALGGELWKEARRSDSAGEGTEARHPAASALVEESGASTRPLSPEPEAVKRIEAKVRQVEEIYGKLTGKESQVARKCGACLWGTGFHTCPK
jgi:hypothetical protein